MVLPDLGRDEVAHLVSLGHVLVLNRTTIYRLNSWMAAGHPGGFLSIAHFSGRDAHSEILAYHGPETVRRMRHFAIATVKSEDYDEATVGWKPLTPLVQVGHEGEFSTVEEYSQAKDWKADLEQYRAAKATGSKEAAEAIARKRLVSLESLEPPSPPESIDPAVQHRISKNWDKLNEKMETAGLYKSAPLWNYRFEFVRYFGLFAAFLYVFINANKTWHYYLAATLLGACWHQVTFAVHDAAHAEITGNYHTDRVIGILIANFFGGLSCSWWADNHNIHHLVTNHPEHDPDIQHVPFFAISTRFFSNLYSTYYRRTMLIDRLAQLVLPYQDKLYYFVMSLARFNLFALSYGFLMTKAKPGFYRNLEWTGIAVFWCWFGGLVLRNIPGWPTKIGFIWLCFAVTSPLHVQIVLSHFAQSTEDLGLYETFASRQLRTTMDVTCPEYMEWIHGGLNNQVSHHLFPRLPRHHLRKASLLVRQFCQEEGLEYSTYGFLEGNGRVLKVLKDVADQVQFMGKVASAMQRGELSH